MATKSDAIREMDAEGRTYLYQEKIEIYWNDWWTSPIADFEPQAGSDEIRIEIVGDGKTVDFIGVLAISCMDDKVFWISGANFGDELAANRIDKYVPLEVKVRARKRFCSANEEEASGNRVGGGGIRR